MSKIWKSSERRQKYISKFLTVYEEEVTLPNGKIIPDYSLVKLPDSVIIVATDKNGDLLAQEEYKHAAGKMLLVLPAGHLESDEDPVAAARRELKEETGYGEGDFSFVTHLYEYPTKCLHTISIVRAKDVVRGKGISREESELIIPMLIPAKEIKRTVLECKFATAGAVAAIALSGLI